MVWDCHLQLFRQLAIHYPCFVVPGGGGRVAMSPFPSGMALSGLSGDLRTISGIKEWPGACASASGVHPAGRHQWRFACFFGLVMVWDCHLPVSCWLAIHCPCFVVPGGYGPFSAWGWHFLGCRGASKLCLKLRAGCGHRLRLQRFILLVSFSATLLVVLILGIV